jgi:hypothetical protein
MLSYAIALLQGQAQRPMNGWVIFVGLSNTSHKEHHNNKPNVAYTDALGAYKEGVKQTLGDKVDHDAMTMAAVIIFSTPIKPSAYFP